MAKPKLLFKIALKGKAVSIEVYRQGTEYYGAYYVNNDYRGTTYLMPTVGLVLNAINQAHFIRCQDELWEVIS